MTPRPCNVLFVCTGNSARSIIAEALLNTMGHGRFQAFSAGSRPAGEINPYVREYLEQAGFDVTKSRSKSWDEFAHPGAPCIDLVITVCDRAAGETCPMMPGVPARAHWSAPDPGARMDDPEQARSVVGDAFRLMHTRIAMLLDEPLGDDAAGLQRAARRIAALTAGAVAAG